MIFKKKHNRSQSFQTNSLPMAYFFHTVVKSIFDLGLVGSRLTQIWDLKLLSEFEKRYHSDVAFLDGRSNQRDIYHWSLQFTVLILHKSMIEFS